MDSITIPGFHIIGLAVRTTNQNGQAATDIPALWQRFLAEQVASAIPNKTDGSLYCIYTGYEGDHTLPYTTLLGCKVSSLDDIPEGLTGQSFAGGSYRIFTVSGKLADGIIYQAWERIWEAGMPRVFTADFEVYDERAQNPEDATVAIYIAVK